MTQLLLFTDSLIYVCTLWSIHEVVRHRVFRLTGLEIQTPKYKMDFTFADL